MKDATIYRDANSIFPTGRQLGYPEDPANGGSVNHIDPDALSPYFNDIQVAPNPLGTCDSDEIMNISYSVFTQDLNSSDNNAIVAALFFIDKDGETSLLCSYYLFDVDGASLITTDIYSPFPSDLCTFTVTPHLELTTDAFAICN